MSKTLKPAESSLMPARRPMSHAAQIVYLREPQGRRDPGPQPSQCRDLHAALRMGCFLAEAGYSISDSIVLSPDTRQPTDEQAAAHQPIDPLGSLADFPFESVQLVVQSTRPCLDDSEEQVRKPKYQSNHAIERDINESLRRVFSWLCREHVSLSHQVKLTGEQEWLRELSFGLYRKRQFSLAEATRLGEDNKDIRMHDTTFGYLVFLRCLNQIQLPFLGMFGMSRDDTFRLACSLSHFPDLIAEMLSSRQDRVCVIQMKRKPGPPPNPASVRLPQDVITELVLNAPVQ